MADVEDRDLGYTKIIRNLTELKGAEICVGVLRNAGKGSDDKTDLVDIAVYNEYGTRNIPSRPFLRIATDENGDTWQDKAEKGVNGIIQGRLGRRQVLELIGLQAKGDIQETIKKSENFAPNAEVTILRKGSSAPLIDTGRLRQSINYRIDD